MQAPRKNRQYDAEFKKNTVDLYLSSGKSLNQVGKDLGVPEATVHTWVRKYRSGGNSSFGPKELTTHEKEMLALKRQLAETTMERDILKKAIAIFSRKK